MSKAVLAYKIAKHNYTEAKANLMLLQGNTKEQPLCVDDWVEQHGKLLTHAANATIELSDYIHARLDDDEEDSGQEAVRKRKREPVRRALLPVLVDDVPPTQILETDEDLEETPTKRLKKGAEKKQD